VTPDAWAAVDETNKNVSQLVCIQANNTHHLAEITSQGPPRKLLLFAPCFGPFGSPFGSRRCPFQDLAIADKAECDTKRIRDVEQGCHDCACRDLDSAVMTMWAKGILVVDFS
jgi:hypothetical protein